MKLIKLLAALLVLSVLDADAELNVVPSVQSWTPQPGVFSMKEAKITVDEKYVKELNGVAEDFRGQLVGLGCESVPVMRGKARGKELFLTLETGPKQLAAEGYRIDIGDGVVVRGQTPIGVFYGTRTLLQLLAQDKVNLALPCGLIADWPRYQHRMLMLDVGREPFAVVRADGLSTNHVVV